MIPCLPGPKTVIYLGQANNVLKYRGVKQNEFDGQVFMRERHFSPSSTRNPKNVSVPMLLVTAGIILLTFGSCYYYRLERKLDPENSEWLNRVRYIITSEERRLFLDMPKEEKEDFKQEFWKRRDPDPQTEENEFKMEFDARMEKADDLFIGEGRPGWLTDRGRIWVLFGPPTDRLTMPQQPDGTSQEIWYYGSFPVVFLDRHSSGIYKLMTYNLTSMRSTNLMYMHELHREQDRAQDTIVGEVQDFNFDWQVNAKQLVSGRIEGTVSFSLPFTSIWLKEEDGALSTVLDFQLEIRNAQNDLVWDYEESFEVRFSEGELTQSKIKNYQQEISFSLPDGAAERLREEGKIFATLINRTGMIQLRKVKAFKIE